jgi:hypothetical protein
MVAFKKISLKQKGANNEVASALSKNGRRPLWIVKTLP